MTGAGFIDTLNSAKRCHSEPVTDVTGVGIRSPYSGDIFRPVGTFFRPAASNRQATNLFKIFSYLSCCHFVTIYI